MPGYRADEPVAYFCTVTVLEWLPIFIDRRYCDPIFDSLRHCRAHKGLQVNAYVLMPNHLHMIAGTAGELHPIIRDFKRFTSRTIHERLEADGRTTLLQWLSQATEPARRGRGELGLWRPGFHPQGIHTQHVFRQKLRYMHDNPVRKGLVTSPTDWRCSSARIEAGCGDAPMDVDPWLP
jgi:REP element-mobilizing transposase RayT